MTRTVMRPQTVGTGGGQSPQLRRRRGRDRSRTGADSARHGPEQRSRHRQLRGGGQSVTVAPSEPDPPASALPAREVGSSQCGLRMEVDHVGRAPKAPRPATATLPARDGRHLPGVFVRCGRELRERHVDGGRRRGGGVDERLRHRQGYGQRGIDSPRDGARAVPDQELLRVAGAGSAEP